MTPLRQRLLDELQRRNYAPKTIACYVLHVAQFARHFGRSPDQLGANDLRTWQLHLLRVKHASWSAYNQSVDERQRYFPPGDSSIFRSR